MKLPSIRPGWVLAALVALPLLVFIAWPIGAVLVQGAVVEGPMPEWRLKAATEEALALMPEEGRARASRPSSPSPP